MCVNSSAAVMTMKYIFLRGLLSRLPPKGSCRALGVMGVQDSDLVQCPLHYQHLKETRDVTWAGVQAWTQVTLQRENPWYRTHTAGQCPDNTPHMLSWRRKKSNCVHRGSVQDEPQNRGGRGAPGRKPNRTKRQVTATDRVKRCAWCTRLYNSREKTVSWGDS